MRKLPKRLLVTFTGLLMLLPTVVNREAMK